MLLFLSFQVRLYFTVAEANSTLKDLDMTNFHSAASNTETGAESDLSETDDEDSDDFRYGQITEV